MKELEVAADAITRAIHMANLRVHPEVTLTFGGQSDLWRFIATMKRATDALVGPEIFDSDPHKLNLPGITFKLAVRQVDAP